MRKLTKIILKAPTILTVITAVVILLTIVLLPLLDFLDFEPTWLNPEIAKNFQLIDFPEFGDQAPDIRLRAFGGIGYLVFATIATYFGFALRRSKSRVKAVAKHFAEFSESYTETLSKSILNLGKLSATAKTAVEEVEEHDRPDSEAISKKVATDTWKLLRNACNELSKIGEVYTGERCSVNIKSFSLHSGAVITYARDGRSIKERSYVDDSYREEARSYTYNSVFREIVDKNSPYSIIKDINKFEKSGKYSNNANSTRREHYNSCLVVPITYRRRHQSKAEVYGFLCIDSMDAKFKNDYFLEVAIMMATLLAPYFDTIMNRLAVETVALKNGD